MQIDEFRKFNRLQQWHIAKELGSIFFHKTNPNHHIRIFQMDGYFVEIWENLNNQMLDSLEVYQSSRLLEKYASQIDLNDLY